MGIMDMVTQMAGQLEGGGSSNKAQVTGGLMEELENRPGGIGSIFQAFQSNGLGGLVQQWSGGNTAPASPEQVEQGLGGTGVIDSIAQRTGLSPMVIKIGLSVAIPVLIHHFVSNGHVTPDGQPTGAPPPEPGGLLQSVLGRIL